MRPFFLSKVFRLLETKKDRKQSKAKIMFKQRIVKSVIYLVIGLIITIIFAYLQNPQQNFLLQPLPGVALVILILFLWLSIKSVIDAYTFYLFAKIVEVIKQFSSIKEQETVKQIPLHPKSLPSVSRIEENIAEKVKQVPILPKNEQMLQTPQKTTITKQTENKKVCPYCGRELPYGDIHIICPYCGHRLK